MSSEKSTIVENDGFVDRFIEVCRSDRPAEIKQLLNISDQAARNYLQGRLPTAEILIAIAERTRYSIHWLLTGRGEKFAEAALEIKPSELSDELRLAIRKVCVEVFGELQQPRKKVVRLGADKVKSESPAGIPVRTEKKPR